MSPRPPSTPPALPGYEYLSLLGSGGFADVFCYRQERPQRDVAVKVMLSGVSDPEVRRLFESEANVMAAVSTHPSIVTIHQADVSADGRPYIVMEYCSRPNYGVRFRAERIAVAEALRVGVQIAGAVETAHRAGILHRDIKPANILVTAYNRPALTDFGISIAAAEGGDIDDSVGMSIPWSPPEFFADPPRADVRSDVFSLAATVYSLLAGRTPFETAGARPSAADLIRRIETQPLAPLERPDAPASLARVLSVAMAKDPAARYDSALALGRALQSVEAEMSLPVTGMDVLEDPSTAPPALHDDDGIDAHTRIRSITVVPQGDGGAAPRRDPYAAIAPAPGHRSATAPSAASSSDPGDAVETTRRAPAAATVPPAQDPLPDDEASGRSARPALPAWLVVTLAAVAVVVLGIGSVLVVRSAFPEIPEPVDAVTQSAVPIVAGSPDAKVDAEAIQIEIIEMGAVDKARIAWPRPEGVTADDTYRVRWDIAEDNYGRYAQPVSVKGYDSVVLDMPPNQSEVCIIVQVMLADGRPAGESRTCRTL
ncbi:serine/threonine-protein kinase [Brachybacterium huguangmaarense]